MPVSAQGIDWVFYLLCVSSMKLKQGLKDSLSYSESIYTSFNLNKLMPLHLWSPLDGTHK